MARSPGSCAGPTSGPPCLRTIKPQQPPHLRGFAAEPPKKDPGDAVRPRQPKLGCHAFGVVEPNGVLPAVLVHVGEPRRLAGVVVGYPDLMSPDQCLHLIPSDRLGAAVVDPVVA